MQEFMETYNANVKDIERFLAETMHNLGNLSLEEVLFKIAIADYSHWEYLST